MNARQPQPTGQADMDSAFSGSVDRARRAFLKRSAYAGGGLLLALTLPTLKGASRAASVTSGELNAWLRIARDDSITVLVDRSEMGQGVYTALPT
ncbi:MAG: xanthine dehydrogenase family protein molybdopterin-binding subunit, partial [Gammaproteobacteria bacterium]|nr:xanthine dehydrogenase family protein molybdopterin-binding subunit [Gammaproteobacteria bacterium]